MPAPSSRDTPPAAVALIGVGGYGSSHLQQLRALEQEGLCRLAAVADPFPERLPALHAELAARGVRWHLDYRELLAAERGLELIVIATPIPLHEIMVRAALTQTDAAILLEKPPVPTLGQLHSLIELDAARRVHIAFQMMRYPAMRQLQAWIDEGRLGTMQRITAGAAWPRGDQYYQRAGWAGRLLDDAGAPVFDGPATNALAHLAHQIMRLGGEGGAFTRPAEVRGEFYRARPIESYDAACLTGRLETGVEYALAVAHCSRQSRAYSVRVEGSAGEAEVLSDGRAVRASFAETTDPGDPYESGLHRETLRRVREGIPPLSSLQDCLGYSEMTCGGLMSSGGIRDVPPEWIEAGEEGPERVYHVPGMAEAVEHTILTGQPWSGQSVAPWAAGPAKTLANGEVTRREFRLADYVRPR